MTSPRRLPAAWLALFRRLYASRPPIDDESPSVPLAIAITIGVRTSTLVARTLEQLGFHTGMVSHGGYASLSRARILGRAVMTRFDDQRGWLGQRRGWRQFLDAPVPHQPVLVTCGSRRAVAFADGWGHFDVTIDVAGSPALTPGWHTAWIQPLHRGDVARSGIDEGDPLLTRPVRHSPAGGSGIALVPEAAGFARIRAGTATPVAVRVVGDDETVGIISDVDDTVMVSNVPRALIAMKRALVDRVSDREAVPGMANLLTTVAQRAQTSREAPVVYLSTGAWNVVPALKSFLARLGFPRGAFLMTNWGPSNTGWLRSGLEHKRRELRRLATDLPGVRWVLVGDDGQRDPLVYSEFAREHPTHVAGIAIRSLTQFQQVLSHGSVDPLVPDALWSTPRSIPLWYGSDGESLLASIRAGGLDRRLRRGR